MIEGSHGGTIEAEGTCGEGNRGGRRGCYLAGGICAQHLIGRHCIIGDCHHTRRGRGRCRCRMDREWRHREINTLLLWKKVVVSSFLPVTSTHHYALDKYRAQTVHQTYSLESEAQTSSTLESESAARLPSICALISSAVKDSAPLVCVGDMSPLSL